MLPLGMEMQKNSRPIFFSSPISPFSLSFPLFLRLIYEYIQTKQEKKCKSRKTKKLDTWSLFFQSIKNLISR